MAPIPYRYKDNRKLRIEPAAVGINPYDLPMPSYPTYTYQPLRNIIKKEAKVAPVPTQESKTAPWAEWLNEFMEVKKTNTGSDSTEIIGLLRVPEDQEPRSDKEAFVYLTTRFLFLMDRLRAEQTPLTRLPEIVIGQVGNGYQAQVTLTLASAS